MANSFTAILTTPKKVSSRDLMCLNNIHENVLQEKNFGYFGWLLNPVFPKWVFPTIGVPQNGWFVVCNGKPYKNGWLGGTTIFGNIQIKFSTWDQF